VFHVHAQFISKLFLIVGFVLLGYLVAVVVE